MLLTKWYQMVYNVNRSKGFATAESALNKGFLCCGKCQIINSIERKLTMSYDMLGKIIVALTAMPQHLGLVLDVIEKMTKPEFARELAKFAKRQACWVAVTIIEIVRNRFNLAEFIGKDWNFWLGPADGKGLEGEIAQDPRSLALVQIDLTKVQFVTMLKGDEVSITGEERLTRLKSAGYIRLDADIFLTLWKNQHLIPESWKEKINGNTCYIFFDGTILRDSGGRRCVLYLFWDGGAWGWSVSWLGSGRRANYPSAVLAA